MPIKIKDGLSGHPYRDAADGAKGNETEELERIRATREANSGEIERQIRDRQHRGADGDVHAVRRNVARSRKQEASDVTEVKSPAPQKRWRRASALPSFPAPPGYVLCWMRRDNTVRGSDDNLFECIEEGWEFCKSSDFPERALPTQQLAKYGDVIGNASSVLMKMPEEIHAQREAYYRSRRDAVTSAVNQKNPGLEAEATSSKMPLVEDVNSYSHDFEQTRVRRARRTVGVAAD